MQETAAVPKENIISERDFAKLDKQLEQTPNISTVAVSGLVCFINKTPEYLENLSQEEKHKMITRAIQEAPNKQVEYKEKKKMIQEAKINQMRAKREKSEMQALAKEKKRRT